MNAPDRARQINPGFHIGTGESTHKHTTSTRSFREVEDRVLRDVSRQTAKQVAREMRRADLIQMLAHVLTDDALDRGQAVLFGTRRVTGDRLVHQWEQLRRYAGIPLHATLEQARQQLMDLLR
jgi:hypothetical protein